MVILPPRHKRLDQKTGHNQDHENRQDNPRVPTGFQIGPMLSEEKQVIHHCAELQVVIKTPHHQEGTEDGRAEHEEPLLEQESDHAHHNPDHHSDDYRNVNMLTEESDVNGRQDKPGDEETDAASGQEYPDVVDAYGKEPHDKPYECGRGQRDVRDPVLGPSVREGDDDEVDDRESNQETDQEEDYLYQPITYRGKQVNNHILIARPFPLSCLQKEGLASYMFYLRRKKHVFPQ